MHYSDIIELNSVIITVHVCMFFCVCTCSGVKNADENELKIISSQPHDTHTYNVADFSIMNTIVEGLTKTVCNGVKLQDKEIKSKYVLVQYKIAMSLKLYHRHCVINSSGIDTILENGQKYPITNIIVMLLLTVLKVNHIFKLLTFLLLTSQNIIYFTCTNIRGAQTQLNV